MAAGVPSQRGPIDVQKDLVNLKKLREEKYTKLKRDLSDYGSPQQVN